ncbi:MAG TPA: YhjD/YihY/BrkB family envelope integrity protein, partial [Ilumatobacteraceae bacterium]
VKWTQSDRVRGLRAKHRTADVAVRTIEGYRDHRSARNATTIAYFGFISVFPLMLVFTTVLGFVLHDNVTLKTDIQDSALAQLPFIGEQIASDPTQLHGSIAALIVGLLVSLWGGMKAFVAVHSALDDIGEQPLDERSNLFLTRVRALLGIAYVGGAQVAGAFLASLASITGVGFITEVLLIVSTALVNTVVLALTYRWLRTAWPSWRSTLPGAIVGGVIFTAMQLLGVAIVGRAIAKASPVYGNFAAVIGLLTWLSLHAVVALGGAELNAALSTTAQPRELTGAKA